MKSIDVIIPVYRPEEDFPILLERLEKQSVKINKIILLHTEDDYELSSEEKSNLNIEEIMISPLEFDHGGTRHRGICESKADYVVCMTQDAIPANKMLIEKLVDFLEEQENVVVSYARQLPKADCHILEAFTRKFNYPEENAIKSKKDIEKLGIKTFFCSNVCAAYKRDKYFEIGGFETQTIFNEDMIFAASAVKAGYSIAYVAEACVRHSHNYTNLQQIKRNFDLAVSQANHPEIFEKIKSESEGIRMVKNTMLYLVRIKKPWLIISLIIKSGCKYFGFFLGKRYKSLPRTIIMKLTMNPRYWCKKEEKIEILS